MKSPKAFSLLVLMLNAMLVFGQPHYAYKEKIATTDSSGFYKVLLIPELLGKCKVDLSDLRIKDAAGKEVPFVIEMNNDEKITSFELLPIVSKAILGDKRMHVILKGNGKLMDHLAFNIQNTDAVRTVNISGSDNNKQWYIVKENIPVYFYDNNRTGSYRITVDLPSVRYQFFDITFNEKELLPANILSAGTSYEQKINPVAQFDTLPSVSIIQKDSSNKNSYITASWNEAYPFEKIKMNVSGPVYYRRNVQFYDSLHSGQFVLDGEKKDWVAAETKSKTIRFLVVNEDNLPLKVLSVQGLVRKKTLYVWLEKEKTYSFYFGNPAAVAASYDLVYFKALIQRDAPTLSLGEIENNASVQVAAKTSSSILWLAIAGVLSIMLYFTWQLTREVKKRGDSTS